MRPIWHIPCWVAQRSHNIFEAAIACCKIFVLKILSVRKFPNCLVSSGEKPMKETKTYTSPFVIINLMFFWKKSFCQKLYFIFKEKETESLREWFHQKKLKWCRTDHNRFTVCIQKFLLTVATNHDTARSHWLKYLRKEKISITLSCAVLVHRWARNQMVLTYMLKWFVS